MPLYHLMSQMKSILSHLPMKIFVPEMDAAINPFLRMPRVDYSVI
jgi:hypothetical protein